MGKHRIGHAPRELEVALGGMGARRDGCGWYHRNEPAAAEARQLIVDAEPRHYLTGDGLGAQSHLKGHGCLWDGLAGKWYAPSEEAAVQATMSKAGRHHAYRKVVRRSKDNFL